jgi:hypothetical protein
MQSQDVLIDLDSLLDTRIGLLRARFPSRVPTVDMAAYVNRYKDNLPELFGVNKNEWDSAWAERDLSVIKSSHATVFAKTLGRLLAPHKVRGDVSPIHDRLHLFINYWPYRLTEELQDEFVAAISELAIEGTLVSMVSHPVTELTPKLVGDRYSAMIMYNAIPWMDAQKEALASHRIPRVTLYTQGVIIDDDPELLAHIERESIDPFVRVKQQLAEYFSLHWWKPSYFSLPLSPSA